MTAPTTEDSLAAAAAHRQAAEAVADVRRTEDELLVLAHAGAQVFGACDPRESLRATHDLARLLLSLLDRPRFRERLEVHTGAMAWYLADHRPPAPARACGCACKGGAT